MFGWITGIMEGLGAAGVALLMFLENLFPPIPSELIMPLAGYLAAGGRLSLAGVIIAGTAGSVAGAVLWYELARRWGEVRFLRLIDRWGPWLTLSREDAGRALTWFRRWGPWAVFLARLVPGVRTLISVPAGLAGMPRGPFLILTVLGSALWVSLLAGAGLVLQAEYHRVATWIDPATTVILLGLLAIYLWRVLRALKRR